MRKLLVLAIAASLLLGTASAADDQDSSDAGAPADPVPNIGGRAPFWYYASGSGNSLSLVYVSREGNLTSWRYGAYPWKYLLRTEGYCVNTTTVTGGVDRLMEFGGDTAPVRADWSWGWLPATVISTSPLTIQRLAVSGRVLMTQKFAFDKTQKDLTITMTIKNMSGQRLDDVRVRRFVDMEVGVARMGSATPRKVMGLDWTLHQPAGLFLEGLTQPPPSQYLFVYFFDWQIDYGSGDILEPLKECESWDREEPEKMDQLAGAVTYDLGPIGINASKTVKFRYGLL